MFQQTEITGFLWLEQLKFLPENISSRQEIFLRLEAVLVENTDSILLNHAHLSVFSTFTFPVLCRLPEVREKHMSQFTGAGVGIRPMIAGRIQNQTFLLEVYEGAVRSSRDGSCSLEWVLLRVLSRAFWTGHVNLDELSEGSLET